MRVHMRTMQAAALCCCIMALQLAALPAAAQNPPPAPVVSYHSSLVDHFSAADGSGVAPLRFRQKILTCATYWRNATGPVLLYTGNEGAVDGFYANTGAAFEWAAKIGALIVFVEHRYYGESLPFGASSFTKANMRYLNIAQALEDYAVIVDALQAQYGLQGAKAVPWIALGGSYGGVLSAWMRSKYPALIAGAIAASAPIRYIGAQEDYSFFAGATSDYAAVSTQCVSAVRAGFAQLQKLRDQGNYAEIQTQLRLCDLPTADTIEHVFLWATNSLLSLAQYGPCSDHNATTSAVGIASQSLLDICIRIVLTLTLNPRGTVRLLLVCPVDGSPLPPLHSSPLPPHQTTRTRRTSTRRCRVIL